MMQDPVTRTPDQENQNRAQGTFNPDAFANQARGLKEPIPLQPNSIPDVPQLAQAPGPISLAQQNYTIPPTMVDYSVPRNQFNAGPQQHAQDMGTNNFWSTLATGFTGLASDFSQQAAHATVQQTQANKELGYQLELQHEAEARNFLETGLDANGKPISAAMLSQRQLQEKVQAGVSAEFTHLTSTGSQALISRKESEDLVAQRTAAAKLEKDTTDVITHQQQLNFLTLAPQRRNTQGQIDVEAGMQQIHDIAQKFPQAQQQSIYANLTKDLYEEAKGSQKSLDNAKAISLYAADYETLKGQGMSDAEASFEAKQKALLGGRFNTGVSQYMQGLDGVYIEQKKLKEQELLNKTVTRQNINNFTKGIDPDGPVFQQQLSQTLSRDPRNVSDSISRALLESDDPKALKIRDALIQRQRDSKDMALLADKIQKEQVSLAQIQQSPASTAAGKPVQELGDLILRQVVDRSAFIKDSSLGPNVWVLAPGILNREGMPTDMGRVMLSKNGRPTPLGMEVPTHKGVGGGYTPYFNPDGSYTLMGRDFYEGAATPRAMVVSPDVLKSLQGQVSVTAPNGARVKMQDAQIMAKQQNIKYLTDEYNQKLTPYMDDRGKPIEGFPDLPTRLQHKDVYRQNIAPFMQRSDSTDAGKSSILRSANQFLGTSSAQVPGTAHGDKACAWAISKVMTFAGVPNFRPTLSTAELNDQLSSGLGVRTTWEGAQPGDIIVTPAHGGMSGHTGMFLDGRTIASNSSQDHVFKTNFTPETWKAQFNRPGDQTFIYHVNGDKAYERQHQDTEIAKAQVIKGASTVATLIPHIQRAAQSAGIPPSILVAQAMLESAHGTSRLATHQNNYFGVTNNGEGTGYRSYQSPLQSIGDQVKRLSSGRYAQLLGTLNPVKWAQGLQQLGYATDSNYAQKLLGVIQQFGLNQLDHSITPYSAPNVYTPKLG